MAITSSTPLPPSTPNPADQSANESIKDVTGVSDYELTREQRIKENRERLMKLGIVDLSIQLKSVSSTPRRTPKYERKTPLKTPLVSSEPRRRSSRLQNAPPVTYVEAKEEKPRRSMDIVLEEGAKPEVYTEEHEKLLGSTEMPWTFFVDGYTADGTRIYDSVQGKTCHQCRQKTMGQRTRCCKCNLVQGQFCGDCLYMRYGEHVVEANQNPNWICPPCRGICNCSLCRQAKGWAPTGTLYKRISKLGYKSVAHYLIQTRRAPPADTVPDTQQSAKRSLPFEGMEVHGEDCSEDLAGDTKTEITEQSESNAAPDTEPVKAPVGVRRSARKSNKETSALEEVHGEDCSEDLAGDTKTEITEQSENNAAPDTEPVKVPVGVRRSARKSNKETSAFEGERRSSRRRINKETADQGEESAVNAHVAEATMVIADAAEDAPVPDNKSPKAIERPSKKAKMENLDYGEDIVSNHVQENGPIPELTAVC
ncbi:hypothetical protein vseg_019373 [Gypsophila vaccaria]